MTDTNVAVRERPAKGAMVQTSSGLVDTSAIRGWGVDANPQNDPTYPYRDRSADDHNPKWERPTVQEPEAELLQSVEHVRQPAVFGNTVPPSWISGSMRRLAFRWSESNWTHWMMLMAADRVNMVEGLVGDLAHGRIPNVPKEMGVPAEWRYNKTGLVKKVAVAGLVVGGIWALARSRRDRDEDDRKPAQQRQGESED